MARPTRTWMSSTGGRCAVLRSRLRERLSRRLGLDGNPLRRRCDRIEALLAPIGTVVFLVLCPVVFLVIGVLLRAENAAVVRAQQSWRPVSAVLLRSTAGPGFPDSGANTWTAWTRAAWTFRGQQHVGQVPVPAGSAAGTTRTIWLDQAGHVHQPPLTGAEVNAWIDGDTILAIGALALLLLVSVWIVRRVLERRRLASWEMDWLEVEPRWSRQA